MHVLDSSIHLAQVTVAAAVACCMQRKDEAVPPFVVGDKLPDSPANTSCGGIMLLVVGVQVPNCV